MIIMLSRYFAYEEWLLKRLIRWLISAPQSENITI